MPPAAIVLWIITLSVAYLAVPLLIILLWRISRAALKIERYARETRIASSGITASLESLSALNTSEELLRAAHEIGGDIADGAEAMAGALAGRVA